jgi:hypothetical protein
MMVVRTRAQPRPPPRAGPRTAASIALSTVEVLGRMEVMSEQDPELAKKAHRAQMILYGVMLLFLVLPFVLLWMKKQGLFN